MKEKKLVKMERDYKMKLQESEEELKLTMQKKTESLARDFDDCVVEYGREQGFDIIADKSTGRLIYVSGQKHWRLRQIIRSIWMS